jgi:AraC-like DNA-binding protein
MFIAVRAYDYELASGLRGHIISGMQRSKVCGEVSVLRKLGAIPTADGLITRLAIDHLKSREIDPIPLLQQARLSSSALGSRQRISAASQIALLELASSALKDDWIGLTLAANFDLRELGMLYYVAASARQLGDALKRLQRYVQIGNEALTVRFDKGDPCSLFFSYAGVPRHSDRHQMEFFQFACLRLCRQLVGRRATPVSVSFAHNRSVDLREAHRRFGLTVEFDAVADQMSFDNELLELPVQSEDTFLSEVMIECCDEALGRRSLIAGPFRTLVENTVKPLLPHGEVRAAIIAQRLAMSERTLARRLAAESCTFGEVCDELRCNLALSYLQEPSLQVSKIAWLIGYRTSSALSHACRRWTGKSPADYRRAQLSRPVAA